MENENQIAPNDNEKVLTETDNIKDNKIDKKNHISNILFIFGSVLFVLAFILMCLFGTAVVDHIYAPEDNQAGTALGMVLTFIYFGLPSLIAGIISCALTITAFLLGNKQKILKLVFMILSILATLLTIIFIILMNVV